jgi:hypothetical protein
MLKTQIFSELGHHEISKMATVINNDSLWDSKSSDDMIEYEQCYSFPCVIECRHNLNPFSEVIHNYDDVSMPPD